MYKKEKIYTPTGLEMFLVPFCVVLFGVLTHVGQVRDRYFTNITTTQTLEYVSTVGRLLDNDFVNSTGLFLFWVIVGTIGYACVVFAAIVSRAYRSDEPIQNYIQTAADRQNIMDRYAARSMALASGVAWLAFTLRYGLAWFDHTVSTAVWRQDVVAMLLAVVGGSIIAFVPVILVRLFVLRTRVYMR